MAVIIQCLTCGDAFKVSKYREDTAKYCSRVCLGIGLLKKETAICAICEKAFDHISSRCNKAKYCSRKCYYKSMKNRGSKTFKCKYCGIEFLSSPSKNRIFCSKSCVGKDAIATWNPKFTTVRGKIIKSGELTHCHDCGYSENKNILGLHHLDKDRNNNKRENIVILCPNCHSIRHIKHVVHGSAV